MMRSVTVIALLHLPASGSWASWQDFISNHTADTQAMLLNRVLNTWRLQHVEFEDSTVHKSPQQISNCQSTQKHIGALQLKALMPGKSAFTATTVTAASRYLPMHSDQDFQAITRRRRLYDRRRWDMKNNERRRFHIDRDSHVHIDTKIAQSQSRIPWKTVWVYSSDRTKDTRTLKTQKRKARNRLRKQDKAEADEAAETVRAGLVEQVQRQAARARPKAAEEARSAAAEAVRKALGMLLAKNRQSEQAEPESDLTSESDFDSESDDDGTLLVAGVSVFDDHLWASSTSSRAGVSTPALSSTSL